MSQFVHVRCAPIVVNPSEALPNVETLAAGLKFPARLQGSDVRGCNVISEKLMKTLFCLIGVIALPTFSFAKEKEAKPALPTATLSDVRWAEVVNGAEFNKDTGKLTWKVTLAPGETVKKQIRFNVKYPKKKFISGL